MQWNEVARIDIKGNIIAVKDAMIMLDEGEQKPEWPFVRCEPGEYIFEINEPTPYLCHRLRIKAVESNPKVANEIGSVDVDHSFIGIIDYQPFLEAISNNCDAYEEWTGVELDDELAQNFSGEIAFNDEKLLYVKSGEGDGTYSAYELVENHSIVGLEVVFIT